MMPLFENEIPQVKYTKGAREVLLKLYINIKGIVIINITLFKYSHLFPYPSSYSLDLLLFVAFLLS